MRAGLSRGAGVSVAHFRCAGLPSVDFFHNDPVLLGKREGDVFFSVMTQLIKRELSGGRDSFLANCPAVG